MHRSTSLILAFVCSAGVSATLIAQDRPASAPQDRSASASKETTITGCLEKNKSGGYWLTHASAGAAQTSTTPAPAARPTTPGSNAGQIYDLKNVKDAIKDIDAHVNHKMEVTGIIENTTSGDERRNTESREQEARDFNVKSVRMVSATCS